MRIAVLIVGLVFSFALMALSVVEYAASGVLSQDTQHEAAAICSLVAVLWLLGAAFVLGMPRVALVLFSVAGLAAFIGAGLVPIVAVAGAVSCLFAAGCYRGYGERLTIDRKQAERDSLLVALVLNSQKPPTPLYAEPASAGSTWPMRA